MTSPATPAHWPEAMATVTTCHYNAGAGRALAFGLPTTRHFEITFNYWANGTLHTGEFTSEKPIPQGTLFPLHFNPEAPHENSKKTAASGLRSPVLILGLVGSVILSLAWFLILRGCR